MLRPMLFTFCAKICVYTWIPRPVIGAFFLTKNGVVIKYNPIYLGCGAEEVDNLHKHRSSRVCSTSSCAYRHTKTVRVLLIVAGE